MCIVTHYITNILKFKILLKSPLGARGGGAWMIVFCTTVHEQGQSNRACNICSFKRCFRLSLGAPFSVFFSYASYDMYALKFNLIHFFFEKKLFILDYILFSIVERCREQVHTLPRIYVAYKWRVRE